MSERDPLAELARLIGEADPDLADRVRRSNVADEQRSRFSIHRARIEREARELRRLRRLNIAMLVFLFTVSGWYIADVIWHGIKAAYHRAALIGWRIRHDWKQ